MQCPKEPNSTLVDGILAGDLAVQCCPSCQGVWIPPEHYKAWQATQPAVAPDAMPKALSVDHTPSSLDSRGALCPDCRRYLSRARVNLQSPFYVERCPSCGGIWCDQGEWEALTAMGLQTIIDRLFTAEWQAKARQLELEAQERQAMIDKLGADLATKVFELGKLLREHPNGDFGVAYLMRRFEQ
ncbi:MAG: zf-TFIIB domain-containing protein [Cyanobacteria bacterium]|nr:zf-TFIIB domain-containing protein [Cyanobacteriota bacterium]